MRRFRYLPNFGKVPSGNSFEEIKAIKNISEIKEPSINLSSSIKPSEEIERDTDLYEGALLSSNGLCKDDGQQKILDA